MELADDQRVGPLECPSVSEATSHNRIGSLFLAASVRWHEEHHGDGQWRTSMLTEELARRFGAKLREIERLPSQLPPAISDLLRAIAQAEQPPPGEADESGSRTDAEETAGK